MRDVSLVHVFDRTAELDHEPSDLRYRYTFPFPYHVHDRSIGAQLQDHVSASVKGECAKELNDIRMSHFRMDLEFGPELSQYVNFNVSQGSGLQSNLLFHLLLAHLRPDHFHRKHPAIAQQLSFIADRKTSLPQKRARGVSLRIFSWLSYNRRRGRCMVLRGWWPLSGRGRRRPRSWLWWIHGGFWFQSQVG